MFKRPSLRPLRAAAAFALVSGALTAATLPAHAEGVFFVDVQIRTGGDDLRGNDDNAFIEIRFGNPELGWQSSIVQINEDDQPIRDYTTTRLTVRPPADGYDIEDIQSVRIYVEGFTGGIDGDNWNVDAINVLAYAEVGDAVISRTVMNEFASPLIRFTGDNHEFIRFFEWE